MMKVSNWVILGTCLALLAGFAGRDARAQQRAAAPGQYNKASEVTLSGVVQSIQSQNAGGAAPHGTYLTLQTASATYTVHLGSISPSALPFKAGASVAITGSLATINGQQIFLARLVQSGGQVLTLRSSNGFVVRGHSAGQTGGLQ